MTQLFAIAALLFVAGAQANTVYYEQLGCRPILEEGQETPTRYDCTHLSEMRGDSCYLGGRHYEHGEEVPKEFLDNECSINCRCVVNEDKTRSKFSCAAIDCPPQHLGNNADVSVSNCIFRANHGQCCSSLHCPEDDEVATCEYDGETVKEGEKFYPKDHPCSYCICDKGFNGTISEPWCGRIHCDMFIHYSHQIRSGCVPTYYNRDDCCPIPTWRCPEEEDLILGDSTATAKSDDHMCQWGSRKLSVGQYLSTHPDRECIECSCEVPPHVSCHMNTTCYEGSR